MLALILFVGSLCLAVNTTTVAPSLSPPVRTPAPTTGVPPTPSECAACDALERCVQQGTSASCECIPGYRRDISGVCVVSRDHIDMKAVPEQIPGKVSAETFEFDVTTMDTRDLWCELLSDPNTGHYKYGSATVRVSGTVTKLPVTLTIALENHITEYVVLLSCYLTPPGEGYESRQALEIRTLNVEGASGIYDQVDTDRLPKFLAPAVLPHTISISVAASAKGPRDLHLDLILAPTPATQSQAAGGKISIAGVSPMQMYSFTLELEQPLENGASAFWSAYLTPPNLTYHNVVPNGWGPTVYVSVGSSPPTESNFSSAPTSPQTIATVSPSSAAPSPAPTLPPSKQPTKEVVAPGDAEGEEGGLGMGWIIFVIVAVLLLVGGLGFFWWRKKRAAAQQVQSLTNLNGDLEYIAVPERFGTL